VRSPLFPRSNPLTPALSRPGGKRVSASVRSRVIATSESICVAKFIHQTEIPSRISNNSLRASETIFSGRSFFWRDGLQPRLRLVQMVERALQVSKRECAVRGHGPGQRHANAPPSFTPAV